MASTPNADVSRYRGNLRAHIRIAASRIHTLLNYDQQYRATALPTYPEQLGSPAEIATLSACAVTLDNWIAAQGPIPARPSSLVQREDEDTGQAVSRQPVPAA